MEIIHIYGVSGSGTTSLGRALSRALGWQHLDTDDYFWVDTDPPYQRSRPAEERLTHMKRDLTSAGRAVVSGSLCGWGDPFIPHFTLAVRLVTPTAERLARLEVRERERFGSRLAPGGDLYDEHRTFMAWAAEYDTGDESMRSKAMHDTWTEQLTCQHLTLDGLLTVKELTDVVNFAFLREAEC